MPRPASKNSLDTAHVPAPVGGLNTVSAASAMPPSDAVYAWNVIAAEYGMRTRLGYLEWCTGLTGAGGDDRVPAMLPFSGGNQSGSTDKLFACTNSGIYDVTASTDTPTQDVAFTTTTGEAGRGYSCVFSTTSGRFLLHTDEVNGLYVYAETGDTWTRPAAGTTQAWAASTTYAVGNKVVNGSNVYTCTTGGVSAGSGGPTGTGTGIADNTVVWDYVSASSATAIGPSLADQRLGYTLNPQNFAFVHVWKNRVWLVEKNTSRAWYLAAGAVYGTATSYDFGSRMPRGGPLAGLYSWSYDGGSGPDTLLVAISAAGDVVMYQGTDPSSASTFALKGAWSTGGVPYGRNLALDFGGETLVVSLLGLLPLSKLVAGVSSLQADAYATAKIANLFNLLANNKKAMTGWGVHLQPRDNALMVTVPTEEDAATEQLVMAFATRGWTQYRDLPVYSGCVWNGDFYFGTTDGRVCIQRGYVDAVPLDTPDDYTPVRYGFLGAYNNLGNARQKQVRQLRPTVLSDSDAPSVTVRARYSYDVREGALTSSTGGTAGSAVWDTAAWDAALWSGEYVPSQGVRGATGLGREVAIEVQGSAISRTTVVGTDVWFSQGGNL